MHQVITFHFCGTCIVMESSGSCGGGGGGSTDASDTTDFNWLDLPDLLCVFSFEAFLSGGGLLDGLFLTFWGGGITGLDGDRSLRFLDTGPRSAPPPPLWEEVEAREGERLRSGALYLGRPD